MTTSVRSLVKTYCTAVYSLAFYFTSVLVTYHTFAPLSAVGMWNRSCMQSRERPGSYSCSNFCYNNPHSRPLDLKGVMAYREDERPTGKQNAMCCDSVWISPVVTETVIMSTCASVSSCTIYALHLLWRCRRKEVDYIFISALQPNLGWKREGGR